MQVQANEFLREASRFPACRVSVSGDPAGRLPDAAWPIPAPDLMALADLGMTDRTIGRYFGVTAGAVAALRARYEHEARGGRG